MLNAGQAFQRIGKYAQYMEDEERNAAVKIGRVGRDDSRRKSNPY